MATKTLTEDQQLRREGFAYALTIKLFPHLRKQNPAGFDRDVQALYEYMLTPPKHGGDPLHLTFYPGSKGYHPHALEHAAQWITGPRDHPTQLSEQLSTGNAQAAAHTLGFTYAKHGLPVPLKGGYLQSAHNPSAWNTVTGIIKDVPGATGRVAGDIGGGAVDAGKGIAGVGGWLGKNVVVVLVLLVVIVLVVKK